MRKTYRSQVLNGLALIILSLFMVNSEEALAQTSLNYSVHANIIYHFTKYMEWPVNQKSGDFIIGIVGETPLSEELQKVTANKKVGNQNIIVKAFPCNQTAYNCQMLFISEDANGCLKKIIVATEGTSVLIISEHAGSALKGSCINFIIVDDKLKFEINKVNIQSRNLKIAGELLSLGTIVQ